MKTQKMIITVSDSIGSVSGELMADNRSEFLYVFAHGAGADMHHAFMVKMSQALQDVGIGTFRFNFPYMEKGGKRPDVPAVAERTVVRAIETARETYPALPLIAGGKSFGGRMTSQAMSKIPVPPVRGIAFVGFPLHAAGNPGTERAAHLKGIKIPMLFLQGTRDALAQISLIEDICKGIPSASLHKFEGADHSFKAGKQDLVPALASAMREWAQSSIKIN